MCSRYIVLLIGFAVCASAEVISEECKDQIRTNTELDTFYECCNFKSSFNETEKIRKEQEDAMKFCAKELEKANNVSDDKNLSPAAGGRFCFFECILKKTGAMNCPAKYWDSSAECSEAKAYIKRCQFDQLMMEEEQL